VVDDVEHRHGDDRADVEPDGDVEGLLVAPRQRPEEVGGEHHPDDGDGDVEGPDEFGVFLAAGEPERERDRRGDDDQLPAPEVERGQEVTGEAGLHQPLRRVVDAGEHHVADEGEDDGVGVQWAQPAEAQPGLAEVGLPEVELGRDEDADQHAHDAPDKGREQELPDNLVVEVDGDFLALGHGSAWKSAGSFVGKRLPGGRRDVRGRSVVPGAGCNGADRIAG
jgi:hypothetical protein